jgi:tryptophan-rich sensory protein
VRALHTLHHAAHVFRHSSHRKRIATYRSWYPTIRKPRWTPPNAAFPVAWTALYGCMGGASWLVWREGGLDAQSLPLGIYATQLALNMAWSPLFFGAHKMARARARARVCVCARCSRVRVRARALMCALM